MKKILIIFFLLSQIIVTAQNFDTLRYELDSIYEKGKELYEIAYIQDKSLELIELGKIKINRLSDGYFSYKLDNQLYCVYYALEAFPHVTYRFILDTSFNLYNLQIDSVKTMFTPLEKELFEVTIQVKKSIKENPIYKQPLNSYLQIIPHKVNDSYRVTVITRSKDKKDLVFGNDFEIYFNGTVLDSVKPIHPEFVKHSGLLQYIISAYHIHQDEFTEFFTQTDICEILLYRSYNLLKNYGVFNEKYVCFWQYDAEKLSVLLPEKAFYTIKMEDSVYVDLFNKNWYLIKVLQEDGSPYYDVTNQKFYERYSFGFNYKTNVMNNDWDAYTYFKISNDTLMLKYYKKYVIEKLSKNTLILRDVQLIKPFENPAYKYVFVSEESYKKFIESNNYKVYINDTLIQANKYNTPFFKRPNISNYVKYFVGNTFEKSILRGHFIINPQGNLDTIYFDTSSTASLKMKEKITEIFYKSTSTWELPITDTSTYYKVDFVFVFDNADISFVINPEKPTVLPLTKAEKETIIFNYNLAYDCYIRKKYDKAIECYTKCIELDSLCFDAYFIPIR